MFCDITSATMTCLSLLCFVLVSSFLLDSVQAAEICDLKSSECLTRSSKNVYKLLVAGIEGLTEPIDPLHIQKINGDVEALKYELTNVTLSGMRNCEVESVSYDTDKFKYEYYLHCPQLIFEYDFKVDGILGSIELNNKGSGFTKTDDYLLILKGSYGKNVSGKDKKPHLFIDLASVETDLKGKLTYENKNILHGNKAKADLVSSYINGNGKTLEKYLRSPMLENFMALFVKTVNMFLEAVPIDEVIPKNSK